MLASAGTEVQSMSLTIVYGVKGLHEAAIDLQVHGLRVRMRHWDAHEGRNYLPPKVLVHQARAGQLGGKACGRMGIV